MYQNGNSLAEERAEDTPEERMLVRLWNLNMQIYDRAYELFGSKNDSENDRLQGVKDTARKTLASMRDLPRFGGITYRVMDPFPEYSDHLKDEGRIFQRLSDKWEA